MTGGRQELAQEGLAAQGLDMKARGFHLALRMLMLSRWGLRLNQKNKISCELLACSESEALWGRAGLWGSQEGKLKGTRVCQQDGQPQH